MKHLSLFFILMSFAGTVLAMNSAKELTAHSIYDLFEAGNLTMTVAVKYSADDTKVGELQRDRDEFVHTYAQKIKASAQKLVEKDLEFAVLENCYAALWLLTKFSSKQADALNIMRGIVKHPTNYALIEKVAADAEKAELTADVDKGIGALHILRFYSGFPKLISNKIEALQQRRDALKQKPSTDAHTTKQSLAAMSAAFVSALEALIPHIQDNTLTIEMIEKILNTPQPGTDIVYEDTAVLRGFCSRHLDVLKENGTKIFNAQNASFAKIESATAGLALIKKSQINEANRAGEVLNKIIKKHMRVIQDALIQGATTDAGEHERTYAKRALAMLKTTSPENGSRMSLYIGWHEKALEENCSVTDLLDEKHKELSQHIINGSLTFDMAHQHWRANTRPEDNNDGCLVLDIVHKDLIFSQTKHLINRSAVGASVKEIEHVYTALGFIRLDKDFSRATALRKEIIEKYAHILRTSANITVKKLPDSVITRPEEPLLSEVVRARSLFDILENAGVFKDFDRQLYDKLTAAIEASIEKPVSPSLNKEKHNEKEKEPEKTTEDEKNSLNEAPETSVKRTGRSKLGVVLKWAAGFAATAAVIVCIAYYYKKQYTKGPR